MDLNNNFADRLLYHIDEKMNPSVVGLDPSIESLPGQLLEKYKLVNEISLNAASEAIIEFNKNIIDAVYNIVPAVKIQIAYYEQLGISGISAFKETADYAKKKGLVVIADVKRNDIGSTSKAYSNAYLGKVNICSAELPVFDVDSVTVNSYLGYEGVGPFIEDCEKYGKGIFILVKTSNKGSEEFQMLNTEKGKNFVVMGELVSSWGDKLVGSSGYSSVGAVVGATFPQEAAVLRTLMKQTIFLVPGYGAQGGGAEDTIPCFNNDGQGALINSSRGIIFAYKNAKDPENYAKYAGDAAINMKNDICTALKNKGIYRW